LPRPTGCRAKFAAAPEQYRDKQGNQSKPPAAVPDGTIYTCPMHPQIRQVGPDSCPICGMALEPEVAGLEHHFSFVPPYLRISARIQARMKMTRIFATAAILVALVPSAALAQHRAGDAALGALSGAVVLGPVGAVAGAVVGYTAGPSIAHSWGLNGSRSRRARGHRTAAANRATVVSPAGAAAAGKSRPGGSDRAEVSAPITAAGNANGSTQIAKPQPASTATAPPVQALE
jgi:hypothetical protein